MNQTDIQELEMMCARFFPVFQDYLRRHSVGSGDIELATTLDGIYSLPCIYDLGGVQKTVRVPVVLLKQDAMEGVEDCRLAAEEARTAAGEANAAAKRVTDAITDITVAKKAAIDAAAAANTAASNADRARTEIQAASADWAEAEAARVQEEQTRVQAELARETAEQQRSEAERVRQAQEELRQTNTAAAIQKAQEAEASALDTATHPTKIGEDNYVYVWNKQTKAYDKTTIYVKGDTFLFSDLTPEDIAELQRPAAEMIQQLETTDNTVKKAEESRVLAEQKRDAAEVERNAAETERKAAETARDTEEAARVQTEEGRVQAEQSRVQEFARLKKESETATTNAALSSKQADSAAENALHLPKLVGTTWHVWDVASQQYVDSGLCGASRSPKIENNIWWVWDDAKGAYVNTHQAVNSTFTLTKEGVEAVLTGDIGSHTHEHLHQGAVVMGAAPTEQTLGWTDSFGQHRFTPGNLVQVTDKSALPGCRVYMFIGVAEGKAQWVQIPCIPSGYKVVIVKE